MALLVDWYAYQGVKTLLSVVSIQTLRLTAAIYWTVSPGVLVLFFYLFAKFIPARKITLLFNTVFNTFLALFITKLVVVLVLILEDITRIIRSVWEPFPHRSLALSTAASILAFIPFCAFLFGVTRGKYHYKIKRIPIYFDDLPTEFDHFSIAQISDIHAGSFDSIKDVKRGVGLLNAQQPDLFVFTGDLVNNFAKEIEPYLETFKQIKAPFGKFSVLGNHDYGDYVQWNNLEAKRQNFDLLLSHHSEMGFRLLLDEHVTLKKGEQQIQILGVENWGVGFGHRGNLEKALNGVDAGDFKILLSHDPTHWQVEVKRHPALIHLTLSGHTHGMQFGIEAFGIKWSPVQYRYKHWAGLATEGGRYLYINRGFGFLGFSGRIGIWPEITIIELRRK